MCKNCRSEERSDEESLLLCVRREEQILRCALNDRLNSNTYLNEFSFIGTSCYARKVEIIKR